MITLTYILLACLPALVTLGAVLVLVPCLAAWHVARATRPQDAPAVDGWDDVLSDLDESPAEGSLDAPADLGARAPKRPLGKVRTTTWFRAVTPRPKSSLAPGLARPVQWVAKSADSLKFFESTGPPLPPGGS